MTPTLSKSFSVTANWPYPIGKQGEPWTNGDKVKWRDERTKHCRSYRNEVLSQLLEPTAVGNEEITSLFDAICYGQLSHGDYPLYALQSKSFSGDKPTALITGGVHGYETSGVQGAIQFCRTGARPYLEKFNLVIIPCVSPWSYERIQRWNFDAIDPNRHFHPGGAAEECRHVRSFLDSLGVEEWACHVDLHETTDSDVTEFRPAKDAMEGRAGHRSEAVPDGFYLVGDCDCPQPDFYARVIEEVRKVTHIAPPDGSNKILGYEVVNGCVMVPVREIFLCASVTNAKFATTTEVYPDSERASDEICNEAQIAAIRGALDYVAESMGL
eukprot:CAMPEP_0172507484 /NCGR_PEP_ID=MMETSP1066-20121228/203972_1 /TAXON_ID=671091 /ORGANISM="Coscinodiscus wailesii, Strain CCMP2513" /LENGTH=326 /DNA_ID=CAMNT_0013285043 /DNA_START=72 /DNA_END=1052 /DNA_ORIENTATION=+